MIKLPRCNQPRIAIAVVAACLMIAPRALLAKVLKPAKHLSPREVVQQYCNLDIAAARLSSQNPYNDAIFALVAWPDEPGWDSATIVSACKIQRVQTAQRRSKVTAQYTVLGKLSGLNEVR